MRAHTRTPRRQDPSHQTLAVLSVTGGFGGIFFFCQKSWGMAVTALSPSAPASCIPERSSDTAFSVDQALPSVLQDRCTVSTVGWAPWAGRRGLGTVGWALWAWRCRLGTVGWALWAGRARSPRAPCPHQVSVSRLHNCAEGLLPLETDLSFFLMEKSL